MKIKLGAIILLCIFILTGCFYQEYEPYEFRQDFDQIVKIEIVQKSAIPYYQTLQRLWSKFWMKANIKR